MISDSPRSTAVPADPSALAAAMRRTVIEQSKRAHVGHIGSCLSVVDLLAALYAGGLRGHGPDRDRLVLSKGHAALALYAALHHTGVLDAQELASFCGEGSAYGTHPEHVVAGVDFSTGSLGHGLPISAGAALAARMSGSRRRAFALLSDAELNEGSVWEALMFAAHHRLGNLVAIVDLNGQQALGHTRDVLDLGDVGARLRAFGWDAEAIDGHDAAALLARLEAHDGSGDRPLALVASTTFGYGVSFMESQIPWHYWPLSDEQYAQAIAELEAAPA